MTIIWTFRLALPVALLAAGCATATPPGTKTDPLLRALQKSVDELQAEVAAAAGQIRRLREQQKSLAADLISEQRTYLSKLTLQLAALAGKSPSGSATVSSTGSGFSAARWIKRVGERRYRIDRQGLNKVLGDSQLLARSARIVPAIRGGRPSGFKLYAVRPGSIYQLMGLRNGDTVEQVDGQAITTPDKALEFYTRLRNAKQFSLTVRRRGVQLRFRYQIVP